MHRTIASRGTEVDWEVRAELWDLFPEVLPRLVTPERVKVSFL